MWVELGEQLKLVVFIAVLAREANRFLETVFEIGFSPGGQGKAKIKS